MKEKLIVMECHRKDVCNFPSKNCKICPQYAPVDDIKCPTCAYQHYEFRTSKRCQKCIFTKGFPNYKKQFNINSVTKLDYFTQERYPQYAEIPQQSRERSSPPPHQ